MKAKEIINGIVSLVFLTTITVSLGVTSSFGQTDSSKEQSKNGYEDLSKYAVTDYNVPEAENAQEAEKRKLKNQRYDKEYFVSKNPHPETGGVSRGASRSEEIAPPPIIPVAESNLVVVGKVVNVTAHLSNDKSGIYSEFIIRVEQILKNDTSKKVIQGESVSADRAGGFVRYPNGQKVLYRYSERNLPQVGSEYVFFLVSDKQSPNYEILTLYELKESKVIPLDSGRSFNDFKDASKQNFIEAIRNKMAQSSQPSD
ncbi:MAG: hypothetical protein M3209_00610 [Acidobacteriota bacterium]|nr:hypothetical protein [Acidobacteriota bacterium]